MNPATPSSPDPARHEEFVRLLGQNQGRVFAFLLTILSHYADAEEVLQQTSLIAWRKFDEFDSSADFVRWTCGIAYREAMSFLKRQRRDRRTFSESLFDSIAVQRLASTEVLDRRRGALEVCLQKLVSRDRQVIESYYFHGPVTAADVAEELQRPVDTVYKALSRIREALHQCIDRAIAAEDRS